MALGYEVSESNVRSAKSNHKDELIEGKHFISHVQKMDSGRLSHNYTLWTKRGIVRLGFFIKSENAKIFRDWAEDLIIDKVQRDDLVKLMKNAVVILGSKTKLAARIGISNSILTHVDNSPNLVSVDMAERIERICQSIIENGSGFDIKTVELLLNVDDKDTRLGLYKLIKEGRA